MSYESKIYFCKEYSFPEPVHCSHIVAEIDMCKMGYSDTVKSFLKCFDAETPFSLYLPDCDDEGNPTMTEQIEDKYESRLKYASNPEKLYRFASQMAKESDYWRFDILKNMIKTFKSYPCIKIVHYGH